MTRFRSSLWALAALVLGGCVEPQSGTPLDGGPGGSLDYGYIPLKRPSFLVLESDAGAVVLGSGVAVTAAHAAHMLPAGLLIGVSRDYDLAFFRTDRSAKVFETAPPQQGERVLAYAHDKDKSFRAEGVVTDLDVAVRPRCDSCPIQAAFAFEGDAGPGYSGGPVLDARNGKLVGIVFGYLDGADGKRTIYAYPMSRVEAELKRLRVSAPVLLPARKD
jgi:hypothetical protein